MEKFKAKRRTLRRQSTIIIKEATTALEGADALQLSALLQRLEVNNSELRKVKNDLESCLPDDIFEEDYAESVQYDDRVNNISEGQESSSPSVMATGVDGKLSEILDFLLLETESRERCREVAHQVRPFFTLTQSG
ncbi:hypothetical protein HPB52_010734 [Rhipicephalus sanguineus]|uniref:Uncharacterized protein n=1 Tax=Rhipicephalus sanguineus TaxID=34632 RepID=A0A9D4T9E6_RHISA|nr:hypothetical protein HPB52_010734 [Rhipicephalus sanguineus]